MISSVKMVKGKNIFKSNYSFQVFKPDFFAFTIAKSDYIVL